MLKACLIDGNSEFQSICQLRQGSVRRNFRIVYDFILSNSVQVCGRHFLQPIGEQQRYQEVQYYFLVRDRAGLKWLSVHKV